MKKLIVEHMTITGQIVEQNKERLPQGVLCRVRYNICNIGKQNRNKRVYERDVWEKVHGDPDIMEKLKSRSLFGHAEHPKETSQSSTEKVSHVVNKMWLDERQQQEYCEVDVLDTPYGRIIDTLLRAGCGLGVSTRAEGDLEEVAEEGKEPYYRVIPESYAFKTVDFTADPSTFGAYPENVERDVVDTIKKGVDDSKIDREYAVMMLEGLKVAEAKSLLESITHDQRHKGCKNKASEKKCPNCTCEEKANESIEDAVAKRGDAFKEWVLKTHKHAWHTLSDEILWQAIEDYDKEQGAQKDEQLFAPSTEDPKPSPETPQDDVTRGGAPSGDGGGIHEKDDPKDDSPDKIASVFGGWLETNQITDPMPSDWDKFLAEVYPGLPKEKQEQALRALTKTESSEAVNGVYAQIDSMNVEQDKADNLRRLAGTPYFAYMVLKAREKGKTEDEAIKSVLAALLNDMAGKAKIKEGYATTEISKDDFLSKRAGPYEVSSASDEIAFSDDKAALGMNDMDTFEITDEEYPRLFAKNSKTGKFIEYSMIESKKDVNEDVSKYTDQELAQELEGIPARLSACSTTRTGCKARKEVEQYAKKLDAELARRKPTQEDRMIQQEKVNEAKKVGEILKLGEFEKNKEWQALLKKEQEYQDAKNKLYAELTDDAVKAANEFKNKVLDGAMKIFKDNSPVKEGNEVNLRGTTPDGSQLDARIYVHISPQVQQREAVLGLINWAGEDERIRVRIPDNAEAEDVLKKIEDAKEYLLKGVGGADVAKKIGWEPVPLGEMNTNESRTTNNAPKDLKESVFSVDYDTLHALIKKAVDDNILDDDTKKQLQESKTAIDMHRVLIRAVNVARRDEAIARAERDTMSEMHQQTVADSAKDIAGAYRRMDEMRNEHAVAIEGVRKQLAEAQAQGSEQARAKANEKLEKFGKELTAKLQDVYGKKMDVMSESHKKAVEALEEAHKKDIAKLAAQHERAMFEQQIDFRVKESNLKLTTEAMAQVKACRTMEEVEQVLGRIRYSLKESLLHSSKPSEVTVDLEGDNQPGGLVDQTRRLVKYM